MADDRPAGRPRPPHRRAVAFYVGSQPRLPAPFGLAANGLVAYAQNGDIFTVDPITGSREAVAIGPEVDREPRWSLDGTRVAFLRASGAADVLVIADRRNNKVVATTDPFFDVDTDTITWSPDGSSITVGARNGTSGALYIVDAADGDMTPLDIPYAGLDVHWRPSGGRQLLIASGTEPDVLLALAIVDLDTGSHTEIAWLPYPGGILRPAGWTPDGQRVVYMRADPDDHRVRTHIVDLATGQEVIVEAMAAHVSNDGSRIVGLNEEYGSCVAETRGGPCVAVGQADQAFDLAHTFGVQWSPDDKWIMSRPRIGGGGAPTNARAVLLDPDGGTLDQPSWLADGGESWQRKAP